MHLIGRKELFGANRLLLTMGK